MPCAICSAHVCLAIGPCVVVYGAFGVLMSWLSAGTMTLGVETLC